MISFVFTSSLTLRTMACATGWTSLATEFFFLDRFSLSHFIDNGDQQSKNKEATRGLG